MNDTIDAWWANEQNLEWQRHIQTVSEFKEYIKQEKLVPKVSDMITSKFLRKEDFPDDQVCTVKTVRLEDLESDGKKEERWILYFREYPKGMVLNITSIRVLEAAFGDDTDYWVGKKATVYVDPNVSFAGKVVGGLRLRPMKEKIPANQASRPQPTDSEDFKDEIPF